MFCCKECFDEKEIVMYIQSQDMIGNCDFCGDEEVNIGELEGVGEFIREGFSRAYDHVEDSTGAIWDSEEKVYIGLDGKEVTVASMLDILYNTEQIFSAVYDEEAATVLLRKLIEVSGPTDREKQDGDTDDYEDIDSECFVVKNALYGIENVSEYDIWNEFKNTCKYYNRYFDISPFGSKREALLSGLHDVFMLMEAEIDEKTTLYRARELNLEGVEKLNSLNLYKEVAPAPAIFATNNRMSPAGISYTYLTTDIKTGLEEICASANKSYIVGKFSPRMNLKLLDLSKNAEIKLMSIFDVKYKHEWIWLTEFIDEFIREISKSISKKDTGLEYVATQVLSEYVRKLGYDGMKYESSKVKGTYNYVLFCGPNPNLCKEFYIDYNFDSDDELFYFSQWLRLVDVQYIKCIGSELDYDIVECINNIQDLQKVTLLPVGKIKFRKFAEISKYLSELRAFLEGKDSVFVNNIKNNNFNLSTEVEGFINKHNENVIRYVIEVNQIQSELDINVVSYCSDCIDEINISTSVKKVELDFDF